MSNMLVRYVIALSTFLGVASSAVTKTYEIIPTTITACPSPTATCAQTNLTLAVLQTCREVLPKSCRYKILTNVKEVSEDIYSLNITRTKEEPELTTPRKLTSIKIFSIYHNKDGKSFDCPLNHSLSIHTKIYVKLDKSNHSDTTELTDKFQLVSRDIVSAVGYLAHETILTFDPPAVLPESNGALAEHIVIDNELCSNLFLYGSSVVMEESH